MSIKTTFAAGLASLAMTGIAHAGIGAPWGYEGRAEGAQGVVRIEITEGNSFQLRLPEGYRAHATVDFNSGRVRDFGFYESRYGQPAVGVIDTTGVESALRDCARRPSDTRPLCATLRTEAGL